MDLVPSGSPSVRRVWSVARRRAPFGLVLLLAAVAASALPAQSPGGGPRLVVDVPEVDLGRIDRGAKATARFDLRNAGDAPLRVLRVDPG